MPLSPTDAPTPLVAAFHPAGALWIPARQHPQVVALLAVLVIALLLIAG